MRNNYLGLMGFLSLTVILTAGCSTTEGTAKLNHSRAPASSPTQPAKAAATEAMATTAAAEPAAPASTDPAVPTAVAVVVSPAEPAPIAAAPVEDTAPAATAAAAPATEAPATPAATAATPSDTQIAAKLLPLPPEDIIKTVRKLTKHPRVLYMSSKAQYNYYVGGQFNAEYSPGKQIFTISNDARQDQPVTCQYGKDGELIDKKKADPDTVNRCGELVHALSDYLSN